MPARLTIIAVSIALLSSAPVPGCDWIATATFCETARQLEREDGTGLAILRVIGQGISHQRKPDSTYYAPLFQVRILEDYTGGYAVGQVITLWSGDHWDCNGPIDYFTEGEEYLVGFPDRLTNTDAVTELPPGEHDGLYQLLGFGNLTYPLTWDGRQSRSIQTVEYGQIEPDRYIERILSCSEFGKGSNVSVYPVPSSGVVRVRIENQSINEAIVYDAVGRRMLSTGTNPLINILDPTLVIPSQELPPGTYVVSLRTNVSTYRRKFIIQ